MTPQSPSSCNRVDSGYTHRNRELWERLGMWEAHESDSGPSELQVPLRFSTGNMKEWECQRNGLKRNKKVKCYCHMYK